MHLNSDGLKLFCCIMDFGKGSKALKLSKKVGAIGGTIFLGKGTIKNEILNMLGMLDIRKEIFITIIDENLEDMFYEEMKNIFHLDKPNHGIAFSMSLKSLFKVDEKKILNTTPEKGVKNVDYEAVFVIVDKGMSDDVLKAAETGGSTGGTVIHARGSGTQEKEKLFNIVIEPEKDVVLILAKERQVKDIVCSIEDMLALSEPGRGIVFTLDVNRTLGLYED